MRFQKGLATFKNKCEMLITMSYDNSKLHLENLEKEIRHKGNIIDQLLPDPQKISTESTRHPQADASVDHQELASMEYNFNTPKRSQNNEPDAEPRNTETRGTIPKKKVHIDNQLKEVPKKHHQKYMQSKIPIPEKNLIPTTGIDTTASSL